MKKIVRLMTLVAATILASCKNDYQCALTTTVNEDGSVTREYTVNVDSAYLAGAQEATPDSMLRFGNSWQLTWSIKGDSSRSKLPVGSAVYARLKAKYGEKVCDTINVNATKHFATVDDAAEETCFRIGRFEIKPTIRLEKSFRFFRTSYRYTESYPALKLNMPVPLGRYFTKEEVGYWFAGEPNLMEGLNGIETDDIVRHLKSQFTEWIAANIFELHYLAILKNYDKVAGRTMEKQQFAAKHDSLMSLFVHDSAVEDLDLNMAAWTADKLGTNAYDGILRDDSIMAEVEVPLNDFMELMMFKVDYKVQMPGGFVLRKQLTGPRLIGGGFRVEPYVSVLNVWAYILTLSVLFISVAWLIYFKRQKR